MHFLGPKRYEQLPAYCKHFDIGLIPFVVNELTRAVNPIKLREYLAAGLGVISTPMPEVLPYKHLIRIVRTPEQFIASATSVLAERPEAGKRRTEAMVKETWPQKLELICAALKF